ncbi:MAG: glycosyltransferase family 1 protein, partial [Shewanella sp.]|nr:glycosyltransferase family 1 protein [Shewanella sp.]
SYGTLLVSCQNPDALTEKFGVYTGKVLGDGFDKLPLFIDGIEKLMTDDNLRQQLARSAVSYIKQVHSLDKFKADMTDELKKCLSTKEGANKSSHRSGL